MSPNAAHAALTAMAHDGDTVTISQLANTAAVSRSWIYTQPEILDRIQQLQQTRPNTRAPRRADDSCATDESLRRRLTLAHQRIAELRTENQQLRQSLARAHGQLRAAKASTPPANNKQP